MSDILVNDKGKQAIQNRRTFAIISHPDAGKTTLTEKFLLYGGAINEAGMVKGKQNSRHAVSDWMEIEKQRGISVTSSVMQFPYKGFCINILDTPGHQDFSEDTYRTLMAADSAVMVIDASKGVEAQTRKLFKVCRMRGIPIFTFINKMDREARDTFDLLSEIETELGIETCPITWPVGSGKRFKGVYNRTKQEMVCYHALNGKQEADVKCIPFNQTNDVIEAVTSELKDQLDEELELLDGAGRPFDLEAVRNGSLSPVFFGSALYNFGIDIFLNDFLEMTTSPLPREAISNSEKMIVDPFDNHFSGFVFKIQANMNKAHRDRVAFFRICSGHFEKGMEVLHVQGDKILRLSQPTSLMAEDRSIVEEAWAGDIISLFDPGVFSIGDTLCDPKYPVKYEGIPVFAPEHFARIRQVDTLKRKQFLKGISEIAQEGAVQIFHEPSKGMEEVIAGVVGPLQLDVLAYRLTHEYNIEVRLENLTYELIRWIENDPTQIDFSSLVLTSDTKLVEDTKGNKLLLFTSDWNIQWALDHNKTLRLTEFNRQ